MTVPLDRARQQRAAGRAREAAAEQSYHTAQAEVAKAKVDSIVKTWNLDPVTFEPLGAEDAQAPS